jgi:hypothetical protein
VSGAAQWKRARAGARATGRRVERDRTGSGTIDGVSLVTSMRRDVFLNIDAGEADDEPPALYALAHAVSIACGGHAGDDASMERVLRACAASGTRAGAHPSFVDREGFGRRAQAVEPAVLARVVASQCAALARIAARLGVTVGHVKPHGALYHVANADLERAGAVVRGAREALGDAVVVLGPPRGALRGRGSRSRARASPIAPRGRTAASSPAASPARCWSIRARWRRARGRSRRAATSTRCASTATPPAR